MCAIFDILKSQIFDFYIIYGLIIFLIFSLNFFELFLIDFQEQFRVNFDIVKPFLIKYSYKSIVFPFSISFMFHKLAFIICPILAIKSSFTVLWQVNIYNLPSYYRTIVLHIFHRFNKNIFRSLFFYSPPNLLYIIHRYCNNIFLFRA